MKRSDKVCRTVLLSLTAAPDASLLLPLSLGQKNELVNQLFGDDAIVLLRSCQNSACKLQVQTSRSNPTFPLHGSLRLQQLVVKVDDFVIQPLSRPQAF